MVLKTDSSSTPICLLEIVPDLWAFFIIFVFQDAKRFPVSVLTHFLVSQRVVSIRVLLTPVNAPVIRTRWRDASAVQHVPVTIGYLHLRAPTPIDRARSWFGLIFLDIGCQTRTQFVIDALNECIRQGLTPGIPIVPR